MYCIKRNHKLKLHVLILAATPKLIFFKYKPPQTYLNLPPPPAHSFISKNTECFGFSVTFFHSFELLVKGQALRTLLR